MTGPMCPGLRLLEPDPRHGDDGQHRRHPALQVRARTHGVLCYVGILALLDYMVGEIKSDDRIG